MKKKGLINMVMKWDWQNPSQAVEGSPKYRVQNDDDDDHDYDDTAGDDQAEGEAAPVQDYPDPAPGGLIPPTLLEAILDINDRWDQAITKELCIWRKKLALEKKAAAIKKGDFP